MKVIELPEFITVRDLAGRLEVSPINVIKELMSNGIMANINQQIDFDTAAIVAQEFGFEANAPAPLVEEKEPEGEQPTWRQILAAEAETSLIHRPPIVTMLGHVDHGKTSLLDVIRQANVAAGEAGGITQHIGAYQARHNGNLITFLDTPGHEAFTAMRARGAQATDIAILVVAADDGVMPQTREAVDHARAARVPIVVALNKIDLPNANPGRVRQQLAEIGLVPDEWAGDTLVIPVSARHKKGIDDLLEAILLTSEELNPRANPQAKATGTVLESRKDKRRGIVVTILVQNGTLHVGDTLLTGSIFGRIRAMYDFRGKPIKTAGPATPVSISGLNGIPQAGDQFVIVESERVARRIVDEIESEKEIEPTARKRITLDEFFNRLQEGETKTLALIIKADVQGSLEPLVNSLNKLSNDEVELEILHASTGNITENDVMLASASNAVIMGFNVEVDPSAKLTASNENVDIQIYTVIYKLIEDVEKALKGLLDPVYQPVVIGRAEVRQVFRIKSVGTVAGCYMRSGEARRNAQAHLIRNGQLIFTGSINSLKHLQENVREVKAGFEFGVNLNKWEDYQSGDLIEFFVNQRVN